MTMPGQRERARILSAIEQFTSEFSAINAGRLIFCNIDWLSGEITMFYRSCCGSKVSDEDYNNAETELKNIYPFKKIIWSKRR